MARVQYAHGYTAPKASTPHATTATVPLPITRARRERPDVPGRRRRSVSISGMRHAACAAAQVIEQDAARRRMAEEGQDEGPMPVEARRSPHDRHDAVGTGELEQGVHVTVAQQARDVPESQLSIDFVAET